MKSISTLCLSANRKLSFPEAPRQAEALRHQLHRNFAAPLSIKKHVQWGLFEMTGALQQSSLWKKGAEVGSAYNNGPDAVAPSASNRKILVQGAILAAKVGALVCVGALWVVALPLWLSGSMLLTGTRNTAFRQATAQLLALTERNMQVDASLRAPLRALYRAKLELGDAELGDAQSLSDSAAAVVPTLQQLRARAHQSHAWHEASESQKQSVVMDEKNIFRASYGKRFAAARAINDVSARKLRVEGKLSLRAERMVKAIDATLAHAKHDAATAARLSNVEQGTDLAEVQYQRLAWPLRLFTPTWLGEAFDPRFGLLLLAKESVRTAA